MSAGYHIPYFPIKLDHTPIHPKKYSKSIKLVGTIIKIPILITYLALKHVGRWSLDLLDFISEQPKKN